MTDPPLSVSVLLDGPVMSQWSATALRRMVETGDAEVVRIVIDESVAESVAGGNPLATLRRYVGSALEYGAWTPALAWHTVVSPPPYLQSRPLSDLSWLDDATVVGCEPLPGDGIGNVLPDAEVDRIAEVSDVVVRFGFGILEGRILTAPEHGVLSFHHGDLRRYRGRPPGVWEFANDEDEAGVTLQRLTEELDGGKIVVFEPVAIEDARTWTEVEARLYAASDDMLATAARRLLDDSFEPESVDSPGELYTTPTLREAIRITAKDARGRIRRLVE